MSGTVRRTSPTAASLPAGPSADDGKDGRFPPERGTEPEARRVNLEARRDST